MSKIELIQSELIAVSKIENNKGQIEGLPKNPRLIKSERFKKMVKSIEDLPKMMGIRELVVVEWGKKYVVLGGNMRFAALSSLKYTEVPCKVLKSNTPIEELKEIVQKDNISFGEDDWANKQKVRLGKDKTIGVDNAPPLV